MPRGKKKSKFRKSLEGISIWDILISPYTIIRWLEIKIKILWKDLDIKKRSKIWMNVLWLWLKIGFKWLCVSLKWTYIGLRFLCSGLKKLFLFLVSPLPFIITIIAWFSTSPTINTSYENTGIIDEL